MVIKAETLERAGIREQPEAVEKFVLQLVEELISQWYVVDAKRDLPPEEAAALIRGGLSLDPVELGLDDPLLRSATEYGALLAASHTVSEAAKMLGVDASRIRQRLIARTIYGMKERAEWRIPRFQFVGNHLLPGIEHVLPRLLDGLHPLEVQIWFTTPNCDLVVGDEETPISPRDWLLRRLDPEAVAQLAADL